MIIYNAGLKRASLDLVVDSIKCIRFVIFGIRSGFVIHDCHTVLVGLKLKKSTRFEFHQAVINLQELTNLHKFAFQSNVIYLCGVRPEIWWKIHCEMLNLCEFDDPNKKQ